MLTPAVLVGLEMILLHNKAPTVSWVTVLLSGWREGEGLLVLLVLIFLNVALTER